jgi:tetratricopeptide (TPR) repeat protein
MKDAAMMAIQKDDHLADAHGALALSMLQYDWNFKGAEAEFKRALELNPSDADIHHQYAHYLMAMGRTAESEVETRRGVELSPMGDGLQSCLCWHSFAARDYDRALDFASRFLSSHPNDPWERAILGWTYEQTNRPEEAIPQFKQAMNAMKGTPLFVAALGHAYAMAGQRTEAEQILKTLLEQSKTSHVSAFDIALIYAALGNKDTAFQWLDRAVNERSTFLVYSKWEPRLDPLRSDPRFKKLLGQVGLN